MLTGAAVVFQKHTLDWRGQRQLRWKRAVGGGNKPALAWQTLGMLSQRGERGQEGGCHEPPLRRPSVKKHFDERATVTSVIDDESMPLFQWL